MMITYNNKHQKLNITRTHIGSYTQLNSYETFAIITIQSTKYPTIYFNIPCIFVHKLRHTLFLSLKT